MFIYAACKRHNRWFLLLYSLSFLCHFSSVLNFVDVLFTLWVFSLCLSSFSSSIITYKGIEIIRINRLFFLVCIQKPAKQIYRMKFEKRSTKSSENINIEKSIKCWKSKIHEENERTERVYMKKVPEIGVLNA